MYIFAYKSIKKVVMDTLVKVLIRVKRVISFMFRELDIFMLLVIGLVSWYFYGETTKFFDPNTPMSVWTPFVSTLFAITQLLIGLFVVVMIVRLLWPGMYKRLDRSFEKEEGSQGYEDVLNQKEKWYVSFSVFFLLLFAYVLLLRIM